ncbi:Geranyl-CoA carboxylase carboxyl transferase subunit [Enhygromyxa salina]|uniref:Geranyl-CoA carboxylase carboxyl transferase subunit n=1 Tax=Enhygromyxa salina TaxID=215803 RepID=A0A0C2D5I2_9BACT|nr:acyl-CoA carboxylase subunit beta [Enhygromyxa salina]KIG18436.1 Geranyl-CoA carboxylase carboxyl transferase subunit [Enhygromyxa salina]
MPTLLSTLDTRSEAYQHNRAQMLALVEGFRELEAKVRAHGEAKRAKFNKRGQLTPRERVARLIDPGSPFLELSTLAGYKMHDDNGRKDTLGGGNIVGIGFVAGVRCLVTANDSAIKGGSIAPMGLQKSLRAQRIALENKLPCIGMVESGGANLNYQSELFVEGGKVFCNIARMSAAGIPHITVVNGSSTAGGAYLPGLSDYVIMVRGRAKVFLAGPPLVKAAIGEDASDEELGGAQMHAEVSGLAEYIAEDDAHGIRIARDVVAKLGWNQNYVPPPQRGFEPPRYDVEELCGVVPPDPRHPWDIRELIARLVDGSDFLEFKARWGSDTVCGHASIEGYALGIVANAGPIMPDGSCKAAQFIQLCCQANIPILYLQNTTGFMVGKHAEQRGAIKHGAKMIQAVANATVPQLTLLVGGGYGAGNYGMCGRAFDPRFIFAWPNAKVAVMGAEQIGMVMEMITKAKFAGTDHMLDEAARKIRDDNVRMMRDTLVKRIESESTALFATARLWDDGIIDPRDSRRVLAMALATCREAQTRTLSPNTFGPARL